MKRIISLLIVLSLLCVTIGCSDRNSKGKSDNVENSIDDTIPGTDTYDNNVNFFFTPTLEPDQNVTLSPEPATTGIPASEPTPTKIPKPEDLPIEEVFTYYPILFPIIDSSTARKSICAAIHDHFIGQYEFEELLPLCSKTHGAWLNLADGIADIVFLVAPTEEEESYFREKKVNIEMKPYGYDGLGFIVSTDCAVKSLTSAQIRGIYEGRINNWSEVGGPDAEIHPYFRNDQSGSQRLFESFLWPDGDAPDFSSMLDHYYFADDMSTITEDVANDPYAIGYNIISYLDLEYSDYIAAIEIDGAAPNTENFRNKSYPFITTAQVAIRADEAADSPARRLFDWIGSEESIRIIAENSSLHVAVGEPEILVYDGSDGAEGVSYENELAEPVIKTAAVAYADYGRILSDCLNMGKMAISSVQHLPIFKFDTYSELESFREKFKDDLCLDEGRDEVASFNESTGECDESFFENNSLIAVYVPAASGSYRFSYRDISIRDGRFYMNVYQINEPEVYTDDMAAWMVLAEYPKPDIESCTEYDAAMAVSPFSEILFEQFLDIMPASIRGVFLFRKPFTLAWTLREESGTDSFNVISYAPFGNDNEKADWEEYTVMDLDGDGSYEAVVLMMDKSRTREFFLVLSEIDGKAYGYEIPFRGMNPLRADGRIYGSSASDQNTIYRFKKFRTDGYETEALAQRSGSEYEVAGSKANASEYASYFNEFEKVDTASWYGLWDIPAIDIIENSQTTESIPAEDDSLKMWNAYADIANAYYSAQKEFKNTGILPGNGLNSLYFAPNGSRMEQISKQDFLVYDINDDGTPEFFISRYYDDEKKDVIYDAYTWNGVMAVRFLKDEEIGYRSGTCDIRENGIILSFYSGSAWDFGFEVLTLPAHANSVMRLENVYAVRAEKDGNYYSEYYRMIEGSDSPERITEEEYRKYYDSFKMPELKLVENVPEAVERLK